ncbi:DUF6528 family protein [Paenibacillus flagellatus]|uniref:WD40 repeat domain-containing protein n=1 Tax=Paenibacillus flagellatus TaxID=2211139 RepID=A0A2V5KFX8_9BACL|nr:DUF6528 family protein [Paenibacillus flagellatus]PYI57103.1 hypothetical protein DLM86_01265 [Paenibacillus flagellatus]
MSFTWEGLVAGTDQASGRIVLLDPADTDWNGADAVRWSWAPDRAGGFDDSLIAAWGVPTDAKIRRCDAWGGLWLVATDSLGLAAVVPFPSADRKRWAANVGGNPHSAELLPNGNVAVASSTGGRVRLYASSQGPEADAYAEFALPGAHGLVWDPRRDVLWALGDDDLVALAVEGSDAEPVMRESSRTALPTRGGHDLQPVYGDADRLWVSTVGHVYQYVKSADAFVSDYPECREISRPHVKSVGNFRSGRVAGTVPKAGSLYEWTTDTVDFHGPPSKRVCEGAAFYKARIVYSDYE